MLEQHLRALDPRMTWSTTLPGVIFGQSDNFIEFPVFKKGELQQIGVVHASDDSEAATMVKRVTDVLAKGDKRNSDIR